MQHRATAEDLSAEHTEGEAPSVTENFVDTAHLPPHDEGKPSQPEGVEQAESEEVSDASIYEALLECARSYQSDFLPRGGNEPINVFADRLVTAIAKAPVDAWEALLPAGQLWYDATVKAQATAQPYPPIPGLVIEPPKKSGRGRPKTKAADYVDAKEAVDLKKKERALKKAAKEAKPKLPERPARPDGYESPVSIIRKFVIVHEDATAAEITAMLQGRGIEVKPATITTIRADTRSTIKDAKALGFWIVKNEPLETNA